MNSSSFLKRSLDFPPIFVRLLARHRHRHPMSTAEIARKAGLLEGRVHEMSLATSWDHFTFGEMKAFMCACDVNFDSADSMSRVYSYLIDGKPNFSYLMRHQDWKKFYLPLLTKWRNSYPLKLADQPYWIPIRGIMDRIPHLHKGFKKL